MNAPILILIIYLLSDRNKDKDKDNQSDSLYMIKNYINTIEIDRNYTYEKIRLAKKIAPLLPAEHYPPALKSISAAERLIKVMELSEFMKEESIPVSTPMNMDSKERIQRIISTVQEENNNPEVKNFGIVLDLIINMDKYKKALSAFHSLKANSGSSLDGNSIKDLMDVFMADSKDKDSGKINDMIKMFDILKNA